MIIYHNKLVIVKIYGGTPKSILKGIKRFLAGKPEVVQSDIPITDPDTSWGQFPLHFRALGEGTVDVHTLHPKVDYKTTVSTESLQKGLERTRSNSAPGLDGVSRANFTNAQLEKLATELATQAYKPRPTKRIAIPKPDGGERYLGISSQRDKVVQAAILNDLEFLVNPWFSQFSYGFRPKLGCHHALRAIKTSWQNVAWIISIDIEKCFDTINHAILLQILDPLMDQPSLELIGKLIKVGYVDIFNKESSKESLDVGTPQGSLISPLLCNIYMHALDDYVQNALMVKWNRGDERKYVEGYQGRKSLDADDAAIIARYPELTGQIERVKHNRWLAEGTGSRDPNDESFRRLHYARYADDFILGFSGTRAEAEIIMVDIVKFLSVVLKFKINMNKSSIEHSGNLGIMFLGTYVRYLPNKIIVDKKHIVPGEINQLKSVAINSAQLRAPVDRILARLASRGFAKVKENGVFRATSNRKLASLDDKSIVNRFSSIIRGILNYYSFVNQKSDLWAVVSLLRKSCALCLADKHKLGSAAAVFKRYGPKITVRGILPKDVTELVYPDTLQTNNKFALGKATSPAEFVRGLELMEGSFHHAELTQSTCQFPGCTNISNLEEHHVNPQANISKSLSPFERSLIAKKRKTITLCQEHHKILHGKKVVG